MTTGARNAGKSEEQIRKERQYQQQRDKLKQFGKPTAGGLDPNKLVDSIFGTSDKPKTKPANITSMYIYIFKLFFCFKGPLYTWYFFSHFWAVVITLCQLFVIHSLSSTISFLTL